MYNVCQQECPQNTVSYVQPRGHMITDAKCITCPNDYNPISYGLPIEQSCHNSNTNEYTTPISIQDRLYQNPIFENEITRKIIDATILS
jgi:hypothetical protein